MDILNKFAENVIDINIQRFGQDIEFKSPVLNDYGEVTDEFEIIAIQKCIYHVSSDYGAVEAKQSDAGKVAGLRKEMLLTYYNEKIKPEVYCNVGDKFYRVYDVNNYQQSDKFIDVLLEEVKHESNRQFNNIQK